MPQPTPEYIYVEKPTIAGQTPLDLQQTPQKRIPQSPHCCQRIRFRRRVFYLGRSYRLKLVDGVNRQPPLRLYQSRFELQRQAQARGREEFVRWYCDRLRSILDRQIAAFVNRVGASPRSVQVRDLGYRWGSCGHKGDLYFHAPCGDATANDD